MLSGGSAESRDATSEFKANASVIISFISAEGEQEPEEEPDLTAECFNSMETIVSVIVAENNANDEQLFGLPTRQVDKEEDAEIMYLLDEQMRRGPVAQPEAEQRHQAMEMADFNRGLPIVQPKG